MKILINASTINQGGAVQVALNLIKSTLKSDLHDYYYIVPQIIENSGFINLQNENCLVVEKSPAKLIFSLRTRRRIKDYEKKVSPQIIYSIGAPSYIKFKAREVLRLTNPFLIGANKIAYSVFPFIDRLKIKVKTVLQQRYIREDHYIITQTETAKKNIQQNLGVPVEQISVIPNVQSSIFDGKKEKDFNEDFVTILTLASPYPHKNLDIIPIVAYNLKKQGINNFQFLVTIPKDLKNGVTKKIEKEIIRNSVEEHVFNLGKVKMEDCPDLYRKSDIVFLPTLLEIASATHIESMAMGVPIVTTDMDFCQETCKNAALYFSPKNAEEAAKKIKQLVLDPELRNRLVKHGKEIIKELSNSTQTYEKHIEQLELIAKSP